MPGHLTLRRQYDQERHAVGPGYPHATLEDFAAFVAFNGHVFPIDRRKALVDEARALYRQTHHYRIKSTRP